MGVLWNERVVTVPLTCDLSVQQALARVVDLDRRTSVEQRLRFRRRTRVITFDAANGPFVELSVDMGRNLPVTVDGVLQPTPTGCRIDARAEVGAALWWGSVLGGCFAMVCAVAGIGVAIKSHAAQPALSGCLLLVGAFFCFDGRRRARGRRRRMVEQLATALQTRVPDGLLGEPAVSR